MSEVRAGGETGGTGAPSPWFTGIEGADLGHIQNKGWDKIADPAEAARTMFKSFREAEAHAGRIAGSPPDRVLTLPADPNDAAAWSKVWQRLGAPADPKDYSFEGVELDEPGQTGMQDMLRGTATRLNLTKDQALGVAKALQEHLGQIGAREKIDAAAAAALSRTDLEKSWGAADSPTYKRNMVIADQAAEKVGQDLGWDPATFGRLREALGSDPLLARLFHYIGNQGREDGFISGQSRVGAISTTEQAAARYGELMGDREWVGKMLANPNGPERREMKALLAINPELNNGPMRWR